MLVYDYVVSKKGYTVLALYYQFKSGKVYRLTGIPYSIIKAIVENPNLNIERKRYNVLSF